MAIEIGFFKGPHVPHSEEFRVTMPASPTVNVKNYSVAAGSAKTSDKELEELLALFCNQSKENIPA